MKIKVNKIFHRLKHAVIRSACADAKDAALPSEVCNGAQIPWLYARLPVAKVLGIVAVAGECNLWHVDP